MKKILMVAAILMLAGSAAMAQTTNQHEEVVQITGRAEKKIAPDEIFVAVTIKDGDIKGQNVNQIESRMKSEFSALGIDVEKSLRMTSMTNAPRKRNAVDTNRSYELKVGNVWTLNSVFETLGEMGVADATVTKVSHSKIDGLRREVRVEAIKSAKENAAVLAGAAGQSIGPAVWILDSGSGHENSPLPVTRYKAMAAGSVYGEGTAEMGLDMQDITISYSVTVKFILNKE